MAYVWKFCDCAREHHQVLARVFVGKSESNGWLATLERDESVLRGAGPNHKFLLFFQVYMRRVFSVNQFFNVDWSSIGLLQNVLDFI